MIIRQGKKKGGASRSATVRGFLISVLGLVGYSGPLVSLILRGDVGVYLVFLIARVGTLFSANRTYPHDATLRHSAHLPEAYSPKCVEGASLLKNPSTPLPTP